MKKYLKSLLLALAGAFVISSCEDVPAPYINPNSITGGSTVVAPEGDGTAASPYNVARLRELINDNQAPTGDIYIKGKVSQIKSLNTAQYTRAQYYISDDGNTTDQFYVYNGLYLGGANFTADDQLKVGDDVVILGQLGTYNNEYQVAQNSKIVNLNGQESADDPTPGPSDVTGEGTKEKPYTVADAFSIYNASQTPTGIWVKGYIVGYIEGQVLAEGAHFNAEGSVVATNILLAASAEETDYAKCLAVQLPVGDVRTRINLKDHAENLKAEVLLCGDIAKYFGTAGLKNTSKYVIGDDTNDSGDNPPSGDGTFDQDFTKGQGSWAIQNVEKGSLNYVWQQTASYGMKASAYVNKANNASESWLISPALEVGNKTTLTINNCLNFLNSGTLSDFISIMVSTNYSGGLPSTANWNALTFSPQPDGSSYTFVVSNADISNYANQTIHVAFRYVSTTSIAPTWEIKSVSAN